jgi:hypothetical protein
MSTILDHIVINANTGMDRAEEVFSSLGFTLTPRGQHTLGSHNHLMMFTTDFLELIGISEAKAHMRPEIANAPRGLNGLVFKSEDVEATFARLQEHGLAGDPPKAFSRPVTLRDGTTSDAKFRTVTARAGALPGARLYFCEHLTPELVWRPEWQSHPNGVTGFAELIAVTPDNAAPMAGLGALLGAQPETIDLGGQSLALNDGFRLTYLEAENYAERYGGLALEADRGGGFLGAVGLRCTSLAAVQEFTRGKEALRVAERGNQLDIAVDDFDTLLSFQV